MKEHNHSGKPSQKIFYPLKIGVVLNLTFFFVELFTGFFSNSLAILGDSLHNLSHGLVLVFSLVGLRLATRPASKTKTFGLRRLEFLVPAGNAVFLAMMGVWLVAEGTHRLSATQQVEGNLIIIVASLDIVANLFLVFLMRNLWKNLTVGTILIHLAVDTLASLGVIIGGAVILLWGWHKADALAAISIGIFSIGWALYFLLSLSHVLLEGVPKGISIDEVERIFLEVPEIEKVHDLHIWSIAEGYNALSCHLVTKTANPTELDAIREAISEKLAKHSKISHPTLQWEFEECSQES